MNLFGGQRSPYMHMARRLPDRPRDVLQEAHYQIVPGDRNVPIARLDLRFANTLMPVTNPDMALALLLDRSGSMTETYRDGHVFNAASAILSAVTGGRDDPNGGFDIAFYDTSPTYAGHVSDQIALQRIVNQNAPRGGGTTVTEALRGVIARYRDGKQGIYVIVVTDGEFSDKLRVEQYVLNELTRENTPENPNRVRLHFVGAGEEVDHEFLKRLETEAAARGVPLVRQHHHAHLRHAHGSMVDELETLYVGAGRDLRLEGAPGLLVRAGQMSQPGGGQQVTTQWQEGNVYAASFLPRRVSFALEYADAHPDLLDLTLRYVDGSGGAAALPLRVPLPAAGRTAVAAATPSTGSGSGSGGGFRLHLPWHRTSPEERAAKENLEQLAQQRRAAELARQTADAAELRAGRIPTGARERLTTLAAREGSFTSDLAPDEIGLLRGRGYRARGLVTGSAMYHVGQAYASAYQDCEVRELSHAYNEATRLAVSRMEQEVRLLGAHGAVGVRYDIVRHEWANHTIEVQLVGTAVDGPGPAPATPWLSDLSGQEWWALERAGYEPAALVYGHCTWFVLTSYNDEQIKRSFQNVEFAHQSTGIGTARRLALQHLTKQAHAEHAHGVTGVRFSHRLDEVHLTGPGENPVYEYEHHNIEMSIIGTAIRLRKDAPRGVQPTLTLLSLRDGRMVPAAVHAADATFE